MSKDGKWRFVHQGQVVTPTANPGGQGPADKSAPTTTTTTMPASSGGSGTTVGAILGVSSTSTEKSLRIFNGRTQYNEWIFAAGQPRVIGRPPTVGAGGTGSGSGTGPGSGKPPSPAPTPPSPQ